MRVFRGQLFATVKVLRRYSEGEEFLRSHQNGLVVKKRS